MALVVAMGAVVATFVFAVGRWGLPIDREQVLAWTLGLVVVVSLATGHRFDAARAVRDWSVLAVLLIAYDYSRGAADWFGMPLQIEAPIIIDRALFPGDVPTVELQARLGPFHGQRWWEAAMSITYATHFVVPHAVTAFLWLRDRSRWRAWLAQFTAVTSAGLGGRCQMGVWCAGVGWRRCWCGVGSGAVVWRGVPGLVGSVLGGGRALRGSAEGPSVRCRAQPEHAEARDVGGCGQQVEVGVDFGPV